MNRRICINAVPAPEVLRCKTSIPLRFIIPVERVAEDREVYWSRLLPPYYPISYIFFHIIIQFH